MLSTHRFVSAAMALLLLGSGAALAGNVSIPNTFTAHTPAVATQVNDNFGAVATALNGSATDIANLQAAMANMQDAINTLNGTVATLNSTVLSQQATISTLTTQMAAVQGSTVMALDTNLALINVPDPNNPAILYRTVQFKSINVQVVNGMGIEQSTNGLGNLIVGYNDIHGQVAEVCSNGQYSDQTSCQSNGGIWARNHRSGSHNLMVGHANAYSQYGGFLVGMLNVANGANASVSGGYGNIASGFTSSVSGGFYNTASANYSSVSGGGANKASGPRSSVSGGYENTASGDRSSVSGGYMHTAAGEYDWRAGSLFQDQ